MHVERHRIADVGWLRAAVLGANDGLISTASLVVGVAAAGSERSAILVAGIAGVTAGAMSMAAGEFVSVSSQADVERADLARERGELAADPAREREELRDIYIGRGLSAPLAAQVADELTAGDALAAHLRDELGITATSAARPSQAAAASAAAFAVGASPAVIVAVLVPTSWVARAVTIAAICLLAILGALAAKVGGAPVGRGAIRVTVWGAAAMGVAALIGRLFGTAI